MLDFGRFGAECYSHETTPSDPFSSLKSPKLIVGRGSAPTESEEWIPVDAFGGAFKDSHSRHLWMDFNNTTALQTLQSDWIYTIVIDWSTWRYMKPCSGIASKNWNRIMQSGAKFVFESGVASWRVASDAEFDTLTQVDLLAVNASSACLKENDNRECIDAKTVHLDSSQSEKKHHIVHVAPLLWEMENPCHILVSSSRLASILEVETQQRIKNGDVALAKHPLSFGRNIIPAVRAIPINVFKEPNPTKRYKQFVNSSINTHCTNALHKEYKRYFTSVEGGAWLFSVKSGDFPVQTNGVISVWIELIKR